MNSVIWFELLLATTALANHCLFIEDICGNKCMDGHRICTCGNTNYSIHEMRTQRLYCCNTSPCETIDKYIVCKTGVAKNVDEKCENECPLSEVNSVSTISSSNEQICTKLEEENKCYQNLWNYDLKMVCLNSTAPNDTSILKYCGTMFPTKTSFETRLCPQISVSKYSFHQCFNTGHLTQESTEKTLCFNRGHFGSDLFKRKIKEVSNKRRNLNRLISYSNENIVCNGTTYNVDELCKITEDLIPKLCYIDKIGVTIDLKTNTVHTISEKPLRTRKIRSSFCNDFSFWSNKKCYNDEQAKDYTTARHCKTYSKYDNYTINFVNHTEELCSQISKVLNTDTFYCKKSKSCIKKSWICDGSEHCIYGEDEDFNLCKNTFPESANFKCLEANRTLWNVTIYATPCDGIVECKDGSDEHSCSWSWIYTFIPISILYFFITLSWCFTYFHVFTILKKDLQKSPEDQKYKPDERYKNTMKKHISEVLRTDNFSELKGDELAHLKNITDTKICADLLEDTGFLHMILSKSFTHFIIGPILLFGHYADLIKDAILVYRLQLSLGGFAAILYRVDTFSSVIVLVLLGSIILPQTLAGLRFSMKYPGLIFGMNISTTKEAIKYGFLTFCLSPLLPLILSLKLQIIYLKDKLVKGNENLNKQRYELKYHLYNMVKLELGLETINQLAAQLIFLFNALSETRTNEGFNVIFNDGLEVWWSAVLVSLSVIWSYGSCSLSHLKGLNIHRDYFPTKSKIVAGIQAMFAIAKRVMCIVLYFTPPLGLFSLLRHLQAEQTKLENAEEYLDGNTGMIQLGNAPPIVWASIDRWNNEEAPNYTLYSIFSLQIYFGIFWLITFCHVFTIFLVKTRWSLSFSKFNLLEKIIHSIENSNMPYLSEDWDVGSGDATDHFQRMTVCKKEGLLVILTNFIFNCILLVPIFALASKITERHEVLYNSIGYLSEEQTAYEKVWIFATLSLIFMIIGTTMEVVFFLFSNEKFHPFSKILSKAPKSNTLPMSKILYQSN